MKPVLFRQIGPYEILEQIGHGGFAMVFLARDTQNPDSTPVALKVLPDGPDAETKDIAACEQRGAELQRMFLDESAFVPRVYDIGAAAGYVYIAMEYLEGADLSTLIRKGPLEPARAATIAIQLCQFLEEVDRMQSTVTGASPLTLLHNDLKPTNVRVMAGDRVKVLDFGAAKTLSMSRRVTRNDFYSTPYLSPECLDTGERDRQTDAWALGVILYEMVAGRAPFHADSTRRLEERIRSRKPADTPTECPRSFQAILAKLLAPVSEDRYPGPDAIRQDLERFLAGTPTAAEQHGWPDRVPDRVNDRVPDRMNNDDEPPTRRTPREAESATRATRDDEGPTRKTPRPAVASPAPTVPVVPIAPSPPIAAPVVVPPKRARFRWVRTLLVLAVVATAINEACVSSEASQLAATVPVQEFSGFTKLWTQYESLSQRSWLGGVGSRQLGVALARQALVLSERVISDYRTPAPTVREAQWQAAVGVLERAVTVRPDDGELRGTLRYCQGQLYRINGEADKSRRQIPQAQRAFADAVTAFREAIALRPNWPDPFLGLARTFIYGIEDIDRGADAMNEAGRLGHPIGDRETAQLADGYRTRGDALDRSASALEGLPQHHDFLVRSRDAYRQALDLYLKVAGYADVPNRIRKTQQRIDDVEKRMLDEGGPPWE